MSTPANGQDHEVREAIEAELAASVDTDAEPSAEHHAQAWWNARQVWLQARANAMAMARTARDIGDSALAEEHIKGAVRAARALAAIPAAVAEESKETQALYYQRLRGPDA